MITTSRLVREYIEQVWNRGNLAALHELTVPDFEYHLGGQPPRDRAAMRQFIQSVRTAFPDWRVAVIDFVEQDARFAARWEGEVTHQGPFLGIPATGKRARVCGINIYRIEEGRIAEEWEQMDSVGLLQQLGVR